ncbi:MAG: DUF4252 domain-containing protein [Bacteroidales bacterium]|nr:DUF4252 domain-containing protein [Bacteroidales bacterium]
MKKLIIPFVVMTLALMPMFTQAQTVIDNLYQKYAGKPDFTSINISPEMFQMLAQFDMNDSSKKVQAAQKAMDQLKGLKMLVYEPKDSLKAIAFYKQIEKMVPTVGFKDLMTVDSHNSKVRFLVNKAKDGKIKELLMIVGGPSQAMVMSLTGLLDMKTISEISKSMNIKGMEDLKKLNDKHEK